MVHLERIRTVAGPRNLEYDNAEPANDKSIAVRYNGGMEIDRRTYEKIVFAVVVLSVVFFVIYKGLQSMSAHKEDLEQFRNKAGSAEQMLQDPEQALKVTEQAPPPEENPEELPAEP